MENKETGTLSTQEFQQVHGIISLHRSRALQTVNNESLLTVWEIGAFVSARLKNSAWGSKTVMQLTEYLRMQDPTLRGYSRRTIYKMVALYDIYSSPEFLQLREKLKLDSFYEPKDQIVSPAAAQLENQGEIAQIQDVEFVQIESGQIVQTPSAQLQNVEIVSAVPAQLENAEFVQPLAGQIVQPLAAQLGNQGENAQIQDVEIVQSDWTNCAVTDWTIKKSK